MSCYSIYRILDECLEIFLVPPSGAHDACYLTAFLLSNRFLSSKGWNLLMKWASRVFFGIIAFLKIF
eukprot:UN05022